MASFDVKMPSAFPPTFIAMDITTAPMRAMRPTVQRSLVQTISFFVRMAVQIVRPNVSPRLSSAMARKIVKMDRTKSRPARPHHVQRFHASTSVDHRSQAVNATVSPDEHSRTTTEHAQISTSVSSGDIVISSAPTPTAATVANVRPATILWTNRAVLHRMPTIWS